MAHQERSTLCFLLIMMLGCQHNGVYSVAIPSQSQAWFSFGALESVEFDRGNFTRRPIDVLKEDKSNPGSFFYNSGSALFRFSPGESASLVLGTDAITRPFQFNDGNSSEARFSLIADIEQYNNSKMAIADFLNSCVREYDFETDMVTTLIGVCGSSSSQSRSLRTGESVEALTTFIGAPIELEYVPSRNYLIVLDYAYLQIVKYDFATQMVELLGANIFESVPNPGSLLTDPSGDRLYVTQSYGLAEVSLDTLEVNLLVGQKVHDRGRGTRPLVTGRFNESSIGITHSLSWLVPGEVIAAVRPKSSEAILLFDLKTEEVTSLCVGSDAANVTVKGDQGTCAINAPTALTVANDTIYVAGLAEGNYDSYTFASDSAVFQFNFENNFCQIEGRSQYTEVSPDQVRYYEGDKVDLNCFRRDTVRLKCIPDPEDPTRLVWNQPQLNCSEVFEQLLQELNDKPRDLSHRIKQ